MRRMTKHERREYAKHPDRIPHDAQCDDCDHPAVARGTDGDEAFAVCGDCYLRRTEERHARPSLSALDRAAAIAAATR